MTNTLRNTPEKVNSTPNRSGSCMLKKIVAGAIALTLSGQPAEAKTFNKQEFPTEMVANIPGEIFPMTENVEQSTLPNYIKQAENGVSKYYPEYENYFKPIFTRTYKLSTSSQNIINKKIQENFELFEEELPTEKDKVTTILLVLEKIISGQNGLAKEIKRSVKGRGLIEIAEEIGNDADQQAEADTNQARADANQARADANQARADANQARADHNKNQQKIALIQKRNKKLDEINEIINNNGINKGTINKIIDKIEEYFTLCEITEIRQDIGIQKIIEQYINCTQKINRKRSDRGKMFIEEYNKINNK